MICFSLHWFKIYVCHQESRQIVLTRVQALYNFTARLVAATDVTICMQQVWMIFNRKENYTQLK